MASDGAADGGTEWSVEAVQNAMTAAIELLTSARPWVAAALAEHAAHAEGSPGGCRLCAAQRAVVHNVAPYAAKASETIIRFADEVWVDLVDDLTALCNELLAGATAAFAATVVEYTVTVEESAGQAQPGPAGPATAPGPAGRSRGFERIDVDLDVDTGGATDCEPGERSA